MSDVTPEPEQSPVPPVGRGLMLAGLAAAIVALLLLAWLANEVFAGDAARFDAAARAQLHTWASPPLTRAMTAISFLGFEFLYLAVPAALVTFLLLHWRRGAGWLAITMAGAILLDVTLKLAFHRTRPVPWFGTPPHSYSFPSGHALVSLCFYGVLAGLITARIRSVPLRVACWMAAALLVAAIGASRIYLGVHYASDVIAGYLTAAMWVGAVVAADRWRRRHKARRSA